MSRNSSSLPEHFDYIIGNPPYNSRGIKKVPTNTKIKKTHEGSTIWSTFIMKSLGLLKENTGKLCMIIPSIWLKQDKEQIHNLLTQYKIEKLHCLTNTETNVLFKGEAQTPTCYFLLTKKKTDNKILLFDKIKKTYEEFDKMFSKVYPKFYKRLNAIAKLSQTDIRLASYIKMNHSNNEISRISGISPRTVESQRYRLSKKLNIAKGQDLNRFIFDI